MISLVMLMLACRPGTPEQNALTDEEPETALSVQQPHFHLQEQPGGQGLQLAPLPLGARVYSLGERSSFTTRLRIGGRYYDEPWLLVELENGQQGWAYAAAFRPADAPPGAGAGLEGLAPLLGEALAGRLAAFRAEFDTLGSPEGLARHLEWGHRLRDSVVAALEQQEQLCQSLPWLEQAFPATSPYRDKDFQRCYLFIDYRPYLAKAAAMPGEKGRRLAELYLAAYPEDSIEYFFPVWVIRDGAGRQHSLLGRGLHFQMLRKLEALSAEAGFAPETRQRLRKALLNDMLDADVTYWESQEKAAAELARILEAGFPQLSQRDIIALQARLLQFAEPEKYRIQFSHRTGIYQLE